jgi:crotonobetainyl-CoA:carnitine CoA-transferase CaiB-like acyl-CoA transferase
MLSGIHVVNLAINVPGAVAGARLHELGATVTKLEPPGGDPLAMGAPDWYALLVEAQEVRCVDLKAGLPEDDLSRADLLLTSARPAALKRLGLGWRALHVMYPRLVHIAIVGHPPPEDDRPGHDLTYVAERGLVSPPVLPRTLVADLGGAERAVSTALALLLSRERTGAAARADVALSDAAAAFAEPLGHGLTADGGILGGGYPFYALYRASDGWLALAALEAHFRDRLLVELGLREATHEALAGVFAGRTAAEWQGWARERDLPLTAIAQIAE